MKLSYLTLILLLYLIPYAQIPGTSYSGPYYISSPIFLKGISDTTISGLEITNPEGHCIDIRNCKNVTVKNCFLRNSTGNGVTIIGSQNISIENCRIDSVASGVYALSSSMIKVTYNTVKNVFGPKPRRQFAQFDKVNGVGSSISYNIAVNIYGESDPEDVISIYKSNGTTSSPIEVIGNWIRGGGPSTSGGGIMTGDGGSSSYILVKDNILVDPGQYGIAVASGENIHIESNKVYAKEQPFTNVGIYVWNQYDSPCNNHTVVNNEVNWTNKKGLFNHRWNGQNCGEISEWGKNIWGADIDASILPEDLGIDFKTGNKFNFKEVNHSNVVKHLEILNNNGSIKFESIQKDITIQVYSLSGKLIQINRFKNSSQVDFTINQSSGIYLCKLLINSNDISIFRLVKS